MFFSESPYEIKTNHRANNKYDDEVIMPKFKYNGDSLMYWAVALSKAGYGSLDLLLSYSSDKFLSIVQYEMFLTDMQAETRAINRRK